MLPAKLIPAFFEGLFLVVGLVLLIVFGLVFVGLVITAIVKTAEANQKGESVETLYSTYVNKDLQNSIIAFGVMFVIILVPWLYSYLEGFSDVAKAASRCRFLGGFGGIFLIRGALFGIQEKNIRIWEHMDKKDQEKFRKDFCQCAKAFGKAASIQHEEIKGLEINCD